MDARLFLKLAVIPAFELLGLDSPAARQMVVAICWQESRIRHRVQIRGPARGFPQFERIGVTEVLTNRSTKARAYDFCEALSIEPTVNEVYFAIAYHDVLAAGFSRLLLYRDPAPLPVEEQSGWAYYLRNWAPGKPHPKTWPEAWQIAENVNA